MRSRHSGSRTVSSAGATIARPTLFGIDLGIGTGRAFPRVEFGLLCLFTLVVVALAVARLRGTALGSAMLAVRANERSAAGIGVNVTAVKIASFAISSFIAGIGGSLFAYRQGVVTFASFTAIGGLALLSTVYLAALLLCRVEFSAESSRAAVLCISRSTDGRIWASGSV